MIKALQTSYNGYSCRSRTEARWMVAFDEAKIKYEYEPQGFDLGEVGCYLPDFYLPQVGMYAEVKGRTFNLEELKKAKALTEEAEEPVLLLDGPPERKAYWAIIPDIKRPEKCGWYEIFESECFSANDYDIFEHSHYWSDERRFYSNTGYGCGSFPHSHNCEYDLMDSEAVLAARSARFEHGESGSTREPISYWDKKKAEFAASGDLPVNIQRSFVAMASLLTKEEAAAIGGVSVRELNDYLRYHPDGQGYLITAYESRLWENND